MNLLRSDKSILTYSQLKKISVQSSLINLDGPFMTQKNSWSKQIIKSSDSFELDLFKKSKSIISFREAVVIRVRTKQGLTIDSKILKGEFSSFKSMKSIESQIVSLDFEVRKKSFDVAYFEIIHTHPTGCYIEQDEEHEVISLGGLSQADYEVANYLEEKYGFAFKLKAVCPGGVTYCSI